MRLETEIDESVYLWEVKIDRGNDNLLEAYMVTKTDKLSEVEKVINDIYGNDRIIKTKYLGLAWCNFKSNIE